MADHGQGWRQWSAAAMIAAPGMATLVLVLLAPPTQIASRVMLLALSVGLSTAAAVAVQRWLYRPMHTAANLIEALREGDFGVRGSTRGTSAAQTALIAAINDLAIHLQSERHGLHETVQLLSKTLAALDSAVFAFEADGRLRLINPAGERLLACQASEAMGKDWHELALAPLLTMPSGSIQAHAFRGRSGRWQLSHALLRSRGQAGSLLVVQPIEQALRREEAQAFQRLLRVLSHEINNSMTPIISMADTLQQLSCRQTQRSEWDDDLQQGLSLISQRSGALQRFLAGYARLARLPPPHPARLSMQAMADDVGRLLDDIRLRIVPDEDVSLFADRDQLEQVLINLIRNAMEASPEPRPVTLSWQQQGQRVRIAVTDQGHGLPASDNLFVPFFTTKPQGSGIGLVLSRQIIEAMDGSLHLERREASHETVATIELPGA